MTIQYGTNFFYALFRWKGSVWKSVWKELLLWLLAYYALRFALIYAVPKTYSDSVKHLILLFDSYTTRLPLEFLLGFYVSQVVSRWWSQTMALSMPNDLMASIAAYIHGMDSENCRARHTCARHIVLTFILAYKRVSSSLQRLFPDMEKLVECGLITIEENEILKRSYPDVQYEIPFQWVQENVRQRVGNQHSILESMNKHRSNFSALAKFNTYNVPLVYTQTVTVAVYGYFIFCLIGHQFYDAETDTIFPFLTILRFLFGVGWLKVAEDLAKPFGDDDDDTNLCMVLQGYIRIVFTIADFVPPAFPASIKINPGNENCQTMGSELNDAERFLNIFIPEAELKLKGDSSKMVDDVCKLLVCKTQR